jgi:hypothetical protein
MRSWFTVGVIVLASGCSKKPAPAVTSTASAAQPGSKVTATYDPNDKHGSRKLMGLDVPVFVDGAQRGVLRYGDLPALEQAKAWNGAKGYRLYDYLEAIGVAPEGVRSVHLHANGDRIGSVEGAELVGDKDRFVFSFLSGETGAPVARWNASGLKNSFVVHEIRKISVFVAKEPAAIDPERQCHLGKDGQCSDAVPYATADAAKGTRVYLDGKMIGFVKRRQLNDGLLLGGVDGAKEHKFSVAKLVASFGADMNGVTAVELVAGDEVVGRADGAEWAKLQASTYFVSPEHSHGKVKVHVPASMQAKDGEVKDRDALVSAVLVYKATKPAARDLVSISEDTDLSVQLASNNAAHDDEASGTRAQ